MRTHTIAYLDTRNAPGCLKQPIIPTARVVLVFRRSLFHMDYSARLIDQWSLLYL